MKIHVHNQLDPAAECIMFLSQSCGSQDGSLRILKNECRGTAEDFQTPLRELESLTEPLVPLEEALGCALAGQEALWSFMFYPGSEEENLIAWSFYLLEQEGPLEELPLPELRTRLAALMLNREDLPQALELNDFLLFLEEYPCTHRTKWSYIQVFQDPLQYYEKYRRMVELAVPALEAHGAALQPLVDKSLDYAHRQFAEQEELGWERYRLLSLINEMRVDDLHITPLALSFRSYGCCLDHTCPGAPLYLFIGVFEQRVRELGKLHSTTSDYYAEQLKTVADPRRMDILKLLKESPRYGRELAEKLEVTPATVSQHMNSLVRDGFVTTHKRGSRISYSLNREKMEQFLDGLRDTFL